MKYNTEKLSFTLIEKKINKSDFQKNVKFNQKLLKKKLQSQSL